MEKMLKIRVQKIDKRRDIDYTDVLESVKNVLLLEGLKIVTISWTNNENKIIHDPESGRG